MTKEVLIENLQLIQHRARVDKDTFVSETIATVIKALEQQPTRPTARWERLVEDYNKCSKCGEMGKLYRIYKYCPNYGAKMDEVVE